MWDSSSKTWALWLQRYDAAILGRSSTSKNNLPELDNFMWKELPGVISSRKPRHVTAAEYAKVVRWKLKRGKWRPRLQAFADSASDADVVKATTAGFRALADGKLREAQLEISALKGCGPATASALLAAADNNVPFMADELLGAVQSTGTKKYTVPAYMQLIESVRAKAAELTKEGGERQWTARDVEQAVFAASHYDASLDPASGSQPEGNANKRSSGGSASNAKGIAISTTGKKKRRHEGSDEATRKSARGAKSTSVQKGDTTGPKQEPETKSRNRRRVPNAAVTPSPVTENAKPLRRSSRKKRN